MGGLTSPKGGDTKTTTQVNSVPSYVSSAQQNLYQSGQDITAPFLQTPSYTTAGVNADMSGAYDLTRYLAQGAFTGASPANAVPAVTGYTPQLAGNPALYSAQLGGNSERYGAANMNAARVGGNDFSEFMNPYIQGVIDPAVANLRRQSDINAAQIGAQGAAAGSFGGSRDAIRQSQNTRALGEQTSQMVSQLMSQGYSQAQAVAQANAQMQQQANQSNQSAQNTAGQFNASANNAMAQFNAGAINSANATNANAANSMAVANSGIVNNASQFGIQQGINAAQVRDALASSDQTRKNQAIQLLLGIGGQQQQLAQANLNTPLTYLQALAGITPQNTGGTQTTTAPNTAPSPLQSLLGVGTGILGLGVSGGGSLGGNLINGAFR